MACKTHRLHPHQPPPPAPTRPLRLPSGRSRAILGETDGGCSVPREADTYDYIVTGAGSAGCGLAARLTETGRYRVLLLEAGGEDKNFWIHVPMGYAKTFVDKRVNWKFESEPEKEL